MAKRKVKSATTRKALSKIAISKPKKKKDYVGYNIENYGNDFYAMPD